MAVSKVSHAVHMNDNHMCDARQSAGDGALAGVQQEETYHECIAEVTTAAEGVTAATARSMTKKTLTVAASATYAVQPPALNTLRNSGQVSGQASWSNTPRLAGAEQSRARQGAALQPGSPDGQLLTARDAVAGGGAVHAHTHTAAVHEQQMATAAMQEQQDMHMPGQLVEEDVYT